MGILNFGRKSFRKNEQVKKLYIWFSFCLILPSCADSLTAEREVRKRLLKIIAQVHVLIILWFLGHLSKSLSFETKRSVEKDVEQNFETLILVSIA